MKQPALEMLGVCKRYRFFELKDLDLRTQQGCVMGLIGPNGAGKSTVIRILMGLVHQDAGRVSVLGHAMPEFQARAKWDIGFHSEDMRLYRKETIAWHAGFMRTIYPDWDQSYAEKLYQRFDLNPLQKVAGLSHGQRVKAGLLLVFARRPRLLILDEPTTGLDPVARQAVIAELMNVMQDDDRTVLFSSHNTQDIEKISDYITFIDKGTVRESNDKESFLDNWRRIRLIANDSDIPPDASDVSVIRSGRTAVVTTRAYTPQLPQRYTDAGLTVTDVETMTLEEIFLASVDSQTAEQVA